MEQQMFRRQITPETGTHVIDAGERIRRIRTTHLNPVHSCSVNNKHAPIHTAVAQEETSHTCYVITTYRLDC